MESAIAAKKKAEAIKNGTYIPHTAEESAALSSLSTQFKELSEAGQKTEANQILNEMNKVNAIITERKQNIAAGNGTTLTNTSNTVTSAFNPDKKKYYVLGAIVVAVIIALYFIKK